MRNILTELCNMKNPGNMLIGPGVDVNTGGTTLVFTGSSEKAFETACSEGRLCHNASHFSTKLLFIWQKKNHSCITDELKLAGQDVACHFWKSFRKNF